MNCQSTRERFADLLDPRMTHVPGAGGQPDELAAARAHLSQCPDCQREYAQLSRTLAALDAVPPAPSPQMRTRFHAMLAEEKLSLAGVAHVRRPSPRPFRVWRWILGPIAACGLVAAGFVAGTYRTSQESLPQTIVPQSAVIADAATRQELEELRTKVEQMEAMNQLVAVALQQQQQPASDRLRGVLTSARQENPSERLINELITSLALDSSTNVRLRALEALYPHASRDVVRAGVLASLSREPNPLVQVAMIDFLAAARDEEAKPALERISLDDLTDGNVREAAKRALAQL